MRSLINAQIHMASALGRWVLLVVMALVLLQLFFVMQIALMAWLPVASTTFERSEAMRLVQQKQSLAWRQNWVSYGQISDHLKRAVIVSEDDGFVYHDGVDWDALEKAWLKNQQTPTKVVGGSTITQQLAKNLFLSGERTLLRKAQEFLLTHMLEAMLTKRRILEIYLNHVEWGEGVFGAEAAARHYFRKSAAQLTPYEAARLAVMLPRPKYFEKLPNSPYLTQRAQVITGRLSRAKLP